MSTQLVSRNNVLAGLFLVFSILLAVFISFLLSDVQEGFVKRTEYVIRFPTSVGVRGLEPGAEVLFGGLAVGRVEKITEDVATDGETGVGVVRFHEVHVALHSDLVLYEDAYADLSIPILGGISKINIPSAGTGSYEGGPADANLTLDAGETFRGRHAPSLLAQMGFTTEEAEAIKDVIHKADNIATNINEVSESLRRMANEIEPDVAPGARDVRTTLANIRTFSENLNADDGWAPKVDSILTRVDDASGKFTPLLDDANATVADIKGVVDDNREGIRTIVSNVEDTTARIKSSTMDELDALLEKGSVALGSYKDVADNANSIVLSGKPKIASFLDSADDIGVQGKLFVEEIRAQPWRLLKKPSEEDLMREPIYEAARAYAGAVSDLRVSSQALDAAVQTATQSPGTISAEEIQRIADTVDEAYGRYADAERALLERLRSFSPTTNP